MTNLMKWIKERFKSDATHYPYWKQQDPARPLVAGDNYFRLTVAEMFLKNDRRWFAEWHPAVYVSVRFRFGTTDETIHHVAGPGSLDGIQGQTNVGVKVNYPVTPLVPFNGGDIEIDAGLVALKGEDDVKQLLKVLGDFSKVLAVPQLSATLSVAEPLSDGIATLVGATDNKLELHFHDTFNDGNRLTPGYFALVDDPKGTLKHEQVSVVDNRLHHLGKILDGYNYVLLRVDGPTQRDDWDSLPSIEAAYQDVMQALEDAAREPDPDMQKKKYAEADRRLVSAKFVVYRTKELTRVAGRNQVIKALDDRYQSAKNQFGSGAAPVTTTSFAEVMKNPPSFLEARARGEMSETDLWLSTGAVPVN